MIKVEDLEKLKLIVYKLVRAIELEKNEVRIVKKIVEENER